MTATGKEKLEQFGFRRNIELSITIGADSWEELTKAMSEIDHMLWTEREGFISISSGGCGSGFTVEGDIDPEWTAERHTEALMKWREAKREEKASD